MSNNTDTGRAPSGRATSLESLTAILSSMFSAADMERGCELKLRPTDIVVSPFGKSGTTWLQQIAHTLRTRGDIDFDDISRVCPWIENATALGLDLNAEQKADPRIFKSHRDAHRVLGGGRYIIACRNPQDVAYSMYKFMEGWTLEPGAVPLDDFVRDAFIARGKASGSSTGDYWTHLASWWARRNDPDVLFMAYEHMTRDLAGTICKVANFMDIELDDELLAITREHASLPYMQQHRDRFDDRMMRERGVALAGLPGDGDSAKVRTGQVGESLQLLGAAVIDEFDEVWRKRITVPLGFADYAELIAALEAGE